MTIKSRLTCRPIPAGITRYVASKKTVSIIGDAYRYTITPVFNKIRDEFSCHIKHKKPDIVYKLWFYVSVVGTEFETPKIYKTITR